MKYRYLITSEQQTKVDKENFGPIVLAQLQKILDSSQDGILQSIGNGIYKKSVLTPGHPTFFWFMETQDDLRVFVLRHICQWDEYIKMNKVQQKKWIEKHSYSDAEKNEINDFIEELSKESEAIVEQKPTLTEAEKDFIYTPLYINRDLFDITIYETENWIKNVQKEEFNDYSNAASTIRSFIYDHISYDDGWYHIEFKKIAILAYHNDNDWILDRILERQDNGNYDAFIKDAKGNFRGCPKDFQRGYPYTYLQDEDNWRVMELDKKSNLVLSKKQVEIVSSKIQYPYMITGRAGSGKSTMLQYLFAEIVLRYLYINKLDDTGIKYPLYISYSKSLVDEAISLCKRLFEKDEIYRKALVSYEIDYKTEIEPIINGLFFEFEKLLRECVDKKEDSSKLFPPTKKISFLRFSSEWRKHFGQRSNAVKKYGPSISWHVIRTYIKGWDSTIEMTPQEYATIGSKNKTVLQETFELIYNEVWEKWYKNLEGVWDDQDLVRYCLNNKLVDERFSAIFCDESQDFTRTEIDFILKLSSFSNRQLSHVNEIRKLPFVFAGDEFQTLNPTGFSWRILSTYFTETLCKSTGLELYKDELKVKDPFELSENFRSTKQIVRLANRIQLLRASRLNQYSTPQISHFPKEGNLVYCVKPTKKLIDDLKEKQVRLIVPISDGESVQEFIENSKLKGLISFDKNGTPDLTILNPMQAKGIEYPNVAIFGFNNDNLLSPLSLDALFSWLSSPSNDDVADIELKYRISSAYVAVTRASSNLYILDDFGENSFWSFAFDYSGSDNLRNKVDSVQKAMFDHLTPKQQNEWLDVLAARDNSDGDGTEDNGKPDLNKIIGLIFNMPEGVDITNDNLEYLSDPEHKRDEEKNAENQENPSMLRMVARYHRSVGNSVDAARCEAKALYFDEEYIQAAEQFIEAKEYDLAVLNYWEALNSDANPEIVSKIAALKEYTNSLIVRVCYKSLNPSVADLKQCLEDVLAEISKDGNTTAQNAAWQYVLNFLLGNIRSNNKKGVSNLTPIIKSSKSLLAFEINIDLAKLASMAYHIGDLKNALSIWDNMDNRPSEYFHAKLRTLKYPATVEYYEGSGAKDWKEQLIQEYRKMPNAILDDSQKRVIVSVIKSVGTQDEFLIFLPFMLRTAQTIDEGKKILDLSDKFECNLNKVILSALIEARFSDLTNWSRPKKMFAVSEANVLLDAIVAVKTLNQDYSKVIDNKIKAGYKIDDIWKEFQKFSRNNSSWLVFLKLGSVIEKRGRYIDAIRFYEWANKHTDDKTLKRALDVRWIACKERQAENDDNDNYRNEAIEKRRRLSIPEDMVIPTDPKISQTDWESLFKYYSAISNEEIVETGEREKKSEEKEIVRKTTLKADRLPLKKQELRYNDYSVVFFPGKGDVVIKDTVNEYQVRIKDGVFPDSGDFILKDSRIYIDEDETPTPFMFEKTENELTIKIYESDEFTGISITIDLPR